MKLGIGVVVSGSYEHQMPTKFVQSFHALHSAIHRAQAPTVTGLDMIWSGKFPTDVARNEVCRTALADGCDRVLFLDADHQSSPDAAIRLIESRHPIVTGRYHVKKAPYHPNLYLTPLEAHTVGDFRTVHYGQGVFPVDRCGAGALAIDRAVLEAIGDPWFRYMKDPRPPHDMAVTEDFYFCERAQAEGFQIMADWDAEFGHILTGVVTGDWYKGYIETMEAGIAHGQPELAEKLVACGFPDGHTLPSGQVIRDYADDSV